VTVVLLPGDSIGLNRPTTYCCEVHPCRSRLWRKTTTHGSKLF